MKYKLKIERSEGVYSKRYIKFKSTLYIWDGSSHFPNKFYYDFILEFSNKDFKNLRTLEYFEIISEKKILLLKLLGKTFGKESEIYNKIKSY